MDSTKLYVTLEHHVQKSFVVNCSPTLSSSSSAFPCQEICRLAVGLNIEAYDKHNRCFKLLNGMDF
jgi:hypothetical protein